MEDPNNEIFFSSASAYEILQKVRLGRLAVPDPIRDDMASAVLKEGWLPLPLTIPEASLAASMQHAHRDPFDRMLAAQSQLNVIAIASTDLFFDELPVERIW